MLPDSYTLTLDRDRSARHDLRSTEYRALVQWLAPGALASPEPASSAGATAQIKQWETFLNGTSGKQQLVSRYLYEHLFIAHIHFAGTHEREFFRLVRSTTPPGQPVNEIATVRPLSLIHI